MLSWLLAWDVRDPSQITSAAHLGDLVQRRLEKGYAVTMSGDGADLVAVTLAALGYKVVEQPMPGWGYIVYPTDLGLE